MSRQDLDMRSSMQMVRRRKKLFGGVAVLGLLLGAAYAYLTAPAVSSTALVVVSGFPPPLTNSANAVGDASAETSLATQIVIANSGPVLAAALPKVGPPSHLTGGAGQQDLRRGRGRQRRPVDYRDREDRRPGGEYRQRGREQLYRIRNRLDQHRHTRGGQDGRVGDHRDRVQAARAHRHIRHLGRTGRSTHRFRQLCRDRPDQPSASAAGCDSEFHRGPRSRIHPGRASVRSPVVGEAARGVRAGPGGRVLAGQAAAAVRRGRRGRHERVCHCLVPRLRPNRARPRPATRGLRLGSRDFDGPGGRAAAGYKRHRHAADRVRVWGPARPRAAASRCASWPRRTVRPTRFVRPSRWSWR